MPRAAGNGPIRHYPTGMVGRTLRYCIALTLLPWMFSATANAWSDLGHRIVALAAEDLLSARAKQRVELFMGEDAKLVNFATWSGNVMADRPETRPWQAIPIKRDATGVDLKRDCPAGQCVTMKLRECIGIVRLGVRRREEMADYLKMLIGLAGDLQQPALSIGPPERTRTSKMITIGDQRMSVMEAWEGGLIELMGTEEEVLERVRTATVEGPWADWTTGTLTDWTWENHLVARERVYPMLEVEGEVAVSDPELESLLDVVIERLAKSSVRLAAILEDVWHK